MTPTVSICIPTYNYGRFLRDAIDSALAQTWTDLEVVVVDNCSTDSTPDILREYEGNERFRHYRNSENIGAIRNWNRCLELARGEFVKVLCADDMIAPTCIERCVDIFRANSAVTLVATARAVVGSDGSLVRILSYPSETAIISGKDAVRNCFFSGNLIGEPSAVMFRNGIVNEGFRIDFNNIPDQEFWMRLLLKGDFGFVAETLCSFRQHEAQGTRESVKGFTVLHDETELKKAYFGIPGTGIPATTLNLLRWQFKVCRSLESYKHFGVPRTAIRQEVRRFMPLPLFYSLLAMHKVFMLRRKDPAPQ